MVVFLLVSSLCVRFCLFLFIVDWSLNFVDDGLFVYYLYWVFLICRLLSLFTLCWVCVTPLKCLLSYSSTCLLFVSFLYVCFFSVSSCSCVLVFLVFVADCIFLFSALD